MINLTTVVRLICTAVVVCLFAQETAFADSVLNFVSNGAGRLVITNTSGVPADVQFTLYDGSGNPVQGVPNPVRHRVLPRRQLALMTNEIFPSNAPLSAGWVQAISPVNGLHGVFLSGDFLRTFESTGALTPFTDQVVPHALAGTQLVLTNPGDAPVETTVRFFNSMGTPVGAPRQETVGAHAQLSVPAPAAASSARIVSNLPLVALGIRQTSDHLTLIEGQAAAAVSSLLVMPHFEAPSSRLVLTNGGLEAVTVDATFFADDSVEAFPQKITVPPNGTVITGWRDLGTGWVRVTSSVPTGLNVLAVVDGPGAATAFMPKQVPLDRMVFPWTEGEGFPQRFATIVDADTAVSFDLLRSDGTTAGQQNATLAAGVRQTIALSELFPQGANQHGGYVVARTSRPVYAVELVYDPLRDLASAIPLQAGASDFTAGVVSVPPVLVRMESASEIAPGIMRLRVVTADDTQETSLVIGRRAYPMVLEPTPFGTRLYADIPLPEPGFLTVRLRSGGADSEPILVAIRPSGIATTTLRGRAYYQKTPVTDAGLDFTRALMVPIRNARVEVADSTTQQLMSVSETDEQGNFQVMVPDSPGLTIRVVSRLRLENLKVLDNTNDNQAYTISVQVDMRDPNIALLPLELIDRSRVSGAFNILDTIQLGNELLYESIAGFLPPDLTIFWSERNTNRTGNVDDGLVGTTYFDLQSRTAYILGNRAIDSDEFDDSVLLHEYAHLLAAQYSRDDSPGGPHGLGDLLDPRLAWSEAWANFFSAAVLRNSIYRDSRNADVPLGVRYDLEENVPLGDRPGYRSEASVQSLLWDLIDDNPDAGDNARFSFAALWAAFTDLRNDGFVYLPSFLDRFLARNPDFADSLRVMGQVRGIDFMPGAIPSMSNPFPKPIQLGELVDGEVDSLTSKRANLAQSAHFYAFTISDVANVTVGLQVRGLGPANNPAFNDLDLFLLDANGIRLHQSDRGLNGQSELIPSVALPAGTYIIEIRSFYTRAETNTPVYNSGGYRLQVQAQ